MQQLLYYPWTLHSKTPRNINHSLITTTIDVIHKIASPHKITSIPGPLTPIANNPDFIPGLNQSRLPKSLSYLICADLCIKPFWYLTMNPARSHGYKRCVLPIKTLLVYRLCFYLLILCFVYWTILICFLILSCVSKTAAQICVLYVDVLFFWLRPAVCMKSS